VVKVVFVSNYLNHHQIPFCNAMYEQLQGSFVFVQTEPISEERLQMGWKEEAHPYLKFYYEESEECQNLIDAAEVVFYGGTDEECYIAARLDAGKPVVRYSERLYKTGQWKAVSPRGLRKKYYDHTRHGKHPVYLFCAGAYVPSDFHIIRAYSRKMFCWGYFPETKQYDVDKLLEEKGYVIKDADGEKNVPYILWAGRFIDWKHPTLPLLAAKYLKDKSLPFHMDIVGGGVLEEEVKTCLKELGLEDCVSLLGYKTPAEVRALMEKADIYLMTSDREEGWGAVANESMNSGCALVVNHMVGAAPYLVRQGQNGYVYKDGDDRMLLETMERLVQNPELCKRLGRNAYHTITQVWNAENAAKNLLELIENVVLKGEKIPDLPKDLENLYPCAPAPVVSERAMWKKLTASGKEEKK